MPKKRLLKKINFLNQRGFSLIELLMTTVIGLIVAAGVATIFIFSMQQMNLLIEKNETEQVSQQIAFYLQRYMSQAVDVDVVSGVINPTTHGQIQYDFDLHKMASNPTAGRYYGLAAFNREIASPTSGGVSTFWPTAIFLKEPSYSAGEWDPKNLSYGIYFVSDPTTPPPPTVALVPSDGALWFSRIHNLRVQHVDCNGKGYAFEVVDETGGIKTCLEQGWAPGAVRFKAKTVTLEVTVRYFKSIDRKGWNYWFDGGEEWPGESYGDVAVTDMSGAYRDIMQTIKINFRNNLLANQNLVGGSAAEERVFGSLYFFNTYVPMSEVRW